MIWWGRGGFVKRIGLLLFFLIFHGMIKSVKFSKNEV